MRAALSLVVAAFVLVPAATAKEVPRPELCGPSECVTVKDHDVLAMLRPYGRPTADPPPLAAFYEVGPGSFFQGAVYYVPEAGMVAAAIRARTLTGESDVVWLRVDERARAVLAKRTREVASWPAPPITHAQVASRTVTGAVAASYARLWRETGRPVPLSYDAGDWQPVDVRSASPSPWTVERPELLYSPSGNVLERGRTLLRLPDGVAADLEAGRALRTPGTRLRRPV